MPDVMRRSNRLTHWFRLAGALGAGIVVCPAHGQVAAATPSRWAGVVWLPGDAWPIGLTLPIGGAAAAAANATNATLDLPDMWVVGLPISVVLDGDSLRFQVGRPGSPTFADLRGIVRGDSATGLVTYQRTTAPFLLRRMSAEPAYDEKRFTVQNGPVTLRGAVLMPRSGRLHSAILFHHGAYQDDRNAFRFWADQLARHGVAAIIYDNRGAGASTGEARTSFDSLAADARAILDVVKRMPGIDPAHLGLFSGSQGGWVSALAAATDPDVKFVVMLAGPGLPVRQNVQWESESHLRGSGFGDSLVQVALSVKWQVDSLAAGGAPWDAIDNVRRSVAYQPWFGTLGIPDRTSWFWAWWKQVGNFDPAPFWRRFRGAVLDIQGTADTQVPWMKSRDALLSALNADRKADATVLVMPGMTHGMFAPYGSPAHVRAHIPSGLIAYVVHWLDQRVPGVTDVRPWGDEPWTELGSPRLPARR
jgi:uncharacterized protein